MSVVVVVVVVVVVIVFIRNVTWRQRSTAAQRDVRDAESSWINFLVTDSSMICFTFNQQQINEVKETHVIQACMFVSIFFFSFFRGGGGLKALW